MKPLLLVFVASIAGCGVHDLASDSPIVHVAHDSEGRCEYCDVFRQVRRGVVKILRGNGIGSGMIVSLSGRILTAAHVVHGADRVDVYLFDGVHRQARVVQSDPGLDLALLEIEGPPADLVPIPLEENGTSMAGQSVVVIGHPFGLEWSITKGIISAVRGSRDPRMPDVIQVDAGVNPGNSGGPLLNEKGHCVGIVIRKMIRGGAEGLGFARPVSMVRDFLSRPQGAVKATSE